VVGGVVGGVGVGGVDVVVVDDGGGVGPGSHCCSGTATKSDTMTAANVRPNTELTNPTINLFRREHRTLPVSNRW
jgi:hypothetical protein